MSWIAFNAFIDDCRACLALLMVWGAVWVMPTRMPQAAKFFRACNDAASALVD